MWDENSNFQIRQQKGVLRKWYHIAHSFSVCKQQKQFKNGNIHIRHMIFTLSCVKPHPTITRLPVLPYSFNLFLDYEMN